MKVAKYDNTGKKVGEVDLPDSVFAEQFSKGAIYTVIRIENRNRRQGTHKTKGISEISGGGKKPWRQKGTGNARQGSTRAPHWRKGATVFGPLPRDYSMRIPAKVRKNGIRAILSARANQSAISVIQDVEMNDFSTKTAHSIFKNMGLVPGNTVAFLSTSEEVKLKKSLSNLALVDYMSAKRMNAPELYYRGHLVITESALKFLEENYGTQKARVGVA